MRKLLFSAGLIFIFCSFMQEEKRMNPVINHNSFELGEQLEYKLNFSIFTVGKGKFIIRDQLYNMNQSPSYKIDIFGKTSGIVDWIVKVDDHWGAYIDTSSLLPHQTFRNIKEGRYRRNEIVNFSHFTDMIEVKVLNQKTGEYKKPEYFYHPEQTVYDMIGGLLYLRTIDFTKLSEGDTIRVDAFFEDTFYNFNTIYKGKEIVKTKLGKFRSLVLVPIMPDNKLFRGDNSIKVWISDDKNKVPLKVEAEMFIGSAGVELISFSGLKNPVSSFVQGS